MAGSVPITLTSTAPDIDAYVVSWGTASGVYTHNREYDAAVSFGRAGGKGKMLECRDYFIAYQIRDVDGNVSALSDELVSWPLPRLRLPLPTFIRRGATDTVVLVGKYVHADATVTVGARSGITVERVSVPTCRELRVRLTAAGNAPLGRVKFVVANPDGHRVGFALDVRPSLSDGKPPSKPARPEKPELGANR